MTDNLIIGLTGSFGSGSGETAKYLNKKGFKIYSLSKVVKKEAITRGITNPKRNDYQNIGDDLRKKFGLDYLAKKICKEINWDSEVSVVIKSIRNHNEALYFQKNFINFYLFNIDAPKEMRYQRVKSEYTSQEDFDKEDERDSGENEPPYGQKVKRCVDLSDIIINNTNKLKNLYEKIEKYLKLIKNPGSNPPDEYEIYMAQAYFWSLRSTCLKRKVGAIIVKQGHIIASGCNDTPKRILREGDQIIEIKIPSCGEKWNYCYRDIFMRCFKEGCNSLITFGHDKCPDCNTPVNKDQKKAIGKHLDLCRAIHAEERAILQVAKLGGQSLENSTIFTTTFPCMLCTKKIIESGISEVVYIDPYPYMEAFDLLQDAEIDLVKFEGVKSKKLDNLYAVFI